MTISGEIMLVRLLLVVALVVVFPAVLAVPPGSSATHAYEHERLPGLGFDAHGGSAATDINDQGVAVGYAEASAGSCCTGYHHAVVWRDGQITDLDTLAPAHGSESMANAINQRGVVVGGWSLDPGRSWARGVAGMWRGGVGRQLWASGVATDINDVNTVVGTREDKAVLWQQGTLRELPGLGGDSAATAVNNQGVVAGWSESASGERHAVVWRDRALVDLGPGQALDISNRGLVVGATPGDGAVVWRGTAIQPLGMQGIAHAVSKSGLVAVVSDSPVMDSLPNMQAFVWDNGDVRLVAEGPAVRVNAVNNRGAVAGALGGPVSAPRASLWWP